MKFSEALLEKVKNLPLEPGVYIMKDKAGDIIYIGKAKALKNRVSNYFQDSKNHSIKVIRMIEHIHDFNYIVTNTEFEALVLECNLIKMHKPKYNILLKDDKAYPFIRIDMTSEYPRVALARKKQKDHAKYYGPYKSSKVIYDTIDLLQKLFQIPNCTKRFPQDFNKGRPCLNYHIKRCIAPCLGNITSQDYKELFGEVISFIEGDCGSVIKLLTNKMEQAAQALEFERAAQLRDRINSITLLQDKQKVYSERESDTDIIATYENGGKVCVTILFIRFGKLLDKDFFIYSKEDFDEDGVGLSSFVKQFYNEDSYIPREVLLDQEIEDGQLIAQRLYGFRRGAVSVRTPKRGELAALMEMAKINSRQELESILTREERVSKTLLDLQKQLGMETLPRRIESYDISNTGDNNMVAGMVVYENGLPVKSEYRKFRIASIVGQDDYTAMKEVLYRRFARLDAGDEKFSTPPNLILLDGGKGHLHVVQEMFKELGILVKVVGMVKDNRHRTKELVTEHGSITIASSPHLYSFIGKIQEEVHRYSIAYHRSLRGKQTMGSALEGIVGVGKARQTLLLKHFKGLKGIKNASLDELEAVKGIPKEVAKQVFYHFDKNVDVKETQKKEQVGEQHESD